MVTKKQTLVGEFKSFYSDVLQEFQGKSWTIFS